MGLSRLGLWNELSGVSVVEPILRAAYEREGVREWREGRGKPPTSFYISSFPGDDPVACGRAAVYGLMDLPDEKPVDPGLQSRFDAGKDLEMNWIRRFAAEGTLLSGNETAGEAQTKFTDPTTWASGAVDAIILPFGWKQGHIVEIKTTSAAKVAQMKVNREDVIWSHRKYVKQCKTYIGYAHELPFAPKVTLCESSWAITREAPMGLRWCPVHNSFDCASREIQLDPPTDGTLIYSSRDEPFEDTVSFYFEYDPDFLAAGRAKLAEWKAHYEAGTLPPHPHEGQRAKWSVEPCKWCRVKRSVCKPDYEAKITTLAESHATEYAKSIRPQYDYASVRAAVFQRWGVSDPLVEKAA